MIKSVVLGLLFSLALAGTGCTVNDRKSEQMVNLGKITDDPEAQLTSLNAAIKSSKQDASLYIRRAVLYLQQQELEKALADAEVAVKLSKSDPAALFIKAQVLRSLKREGEAISLALQAERNGYQNSLLYVLLSDLYLKLQQPDKAKYYNNLAYRLSTADEFVLFYRGRIAAINGDTAAAIKHYTLATQLDSGFFEPRRELAGVYVGRKEFAQGQSIINEAQKLQQKDGLLWYYQGRLFQATEKPDSALWSYNKAVGIADTLVAAHNQMAYLFYTRANYDKAIQHFEKAAGNYGGTVRFLTTLGSSYERTGQYQKALEQYEKLTKAEPAYSYAHQSIARLRSRLARTQTDSTAVLQAIEE